MSLFSGDQLDFEHEGVFEIAPEVQDVLDRIKQKRIEILAAERNEESELITTLREQLSRLEHRHQALLRKMRNRGWRGTPLEVLLREAERIRAPGAPVS